MLRLAAIVWSWMRECGGRLRGRRSHCRRLLSAYYNCACRSLSGESAVLGLKLVPGLLFRPGLCPSLLRLVAFRGMCVAVMQCSRN
jgi:hypothetical protein